MELGTEWEKCVLVYDCSQQKRLLGVNDQVLEKYYNKFIKGENEKDYNIWYDKLNESCFSGAQFADNKNAGKFQHFFSPKSRFLKTMSEHLSGYKVSGSPFKGQKMFIDQELDYICTKQDKLKERFEGKKIIIVGGGPSTNSVSWEDLEYDSLWTCNEFYKNKKLEGRKVDFVSLAPLVDDDLNSGGDMEQAIRSDKDMIVAFPIDRSGYSYRPILQFAKKYTNRTCLYQTRYASVVGTMNRLICLAVFFGASEVMFVGMDGRSNVESSGNLLHAFDGDKPLPNWYRSYGDRFQERQFVVFYDYMMRLKKRFDFKLYNLGEGQKFNASTNITKKAFPMPQEIKNRIKYND